MKTPKARFLFVPAMCALLALVGCGQSSADETKPLPEVKAEAAKMDVSALRDMAMSYKNALTAKQGEIEAVQAKIKEIPMQEMLGEEAKKLKAEVDAISKSVKALKERFEVYYNKLKDMDGDLSGLKL